LYSNTYIRSEIIFVSNPEKIYYLLDISRTYRAMEWWIIGIMEREKILIPTNILSPIHHIKLVKHFEESL